MRQFVDKVAGNGMFLKVAVTVACTLLAAGAIGAIGNYAKTSAIEATVSEMNRRMDRIERKVDDWIAREKTR